MSDEIQQQNESEEIEGLEEVASAGWGEYPLDSVFVRTEKRTVNEVMSRIDKERVRLHPDFQRDFVWDQATQSRLIESALMRIPLPVFYVAEGIDGRITVVDGLQRLTTFHRFVNNRLRLSGLGDGRDEGKIDSPLIGKTFSDLPVNLQERIEDTQLTLYILDSKAPERARLDIFERVNSGKPLSRQQMRNSLYNGPATQWLKDAANSEAFLAVTDGKLDQKSMRDREAINRFCGFKLLGYGEYKGDMDSFLADSLKYMNRMDMKDLDDLMNAFELSMRVNRKLFGKHAFRKSLSENDLHATRKPINISLFDVFSVFLSEEKPDILLDDVKRSLIRLFEDKGFVNAISYSTNDTKQVHARFSKVSVASVMAML